jgi:hypothetical protein
MWASVLSRSESSLSIRSTALITKLTILTDMRNGLTLKKANESKPSCGKRLGIS